MSWVMTGATTGSSTGQVGSRTYNVGVTTVTYTATDGSGNTTTGSLTVTVRDLQTPTITAPANVTVSTDAGQCNAAVTILSTTIGDNCPNPVLSWVMSGVTTGSGSGQIGTATFNKGTTTITYTVTDGSGNTASGTQTVTVKIGRAHV